MSEPNPRIDVLRVWRARDRDPFTDPGTPSELLAKLDAADSEAGWVRINLNDQTTLAALAEAITMPNQFLHWARGQENPSAEPDEPDVQRRAIRVALTHGGPTRGETLLRVVETAAISGTGSAGTPTAETGNG